MAELATLARPYARAAFDVARQAGDDGVRRWSEMLAYLAEAVALAEVAEEIEAPRRTPEGKATLLAEICGDRLDDAGRNFVRVLASNGRLPLLPEIAEQFESLRAELERTLEVEVVSARELSPEDAERLRDGLGRRFGKDVSLTTRIEPSLLGGAVVRAGDTVIDGSIRGRLDRLADNLRVAR